MLGIWCCNRSFPRWNRDLQFARAVQAARPVARDSYAVPHRLVAGVILPCASVAGPHRTTIVLSDPCVQRQQRSISRQIRRLQFARAVQAARPVARDSYAVPHRLVAGVVLPCASVAGPHHTTIALSDPCIQRRQRSISRQIRRLQFARAVQAGWDGSGCGSAVRRGSAGRAAWARSTNVLACAHLVTMSDLRKRW